MPTEWVTLTRLAYECGIDKRTFKENYMDNNPPQRQVGNRKSWTRTEADRIKFDLFGIKSEGLQTESE